jgi:hypothetical protein
MLKMFVGCWLKSSLKAYQRYMKYSLNSFVLNTLGKPLTRKIAHLAPLHAIQKCFIMIQNPCVQATEELSRLVTESACQQPATLKDFQTQELAIEMHTLLW